MSGVIDHVEVFCLRSEYLCGAKPHEETLIIVVAAKFNLNRGNVETGYFVQQPYK